MTLLKLRKLERLQRRELRLTRRLQQNRRQQVATLNHPLYQNHLQQELKRLRESQQLPPTQFDLRHLL